MRPHQLLSVFLAGSLLVPAQQTQPGSSNLVAQGAGLKIVVIEGEGATNNSRSRSGVAPVVEIRDESDKPVPGAEVVFQLPLSGPGGFFNGWLKTQTVRSDKNGRAAATFFTPNDEEGRFNIKVTATAGTRSASGVIAQSNVRGSGGGGSRTAAKSGKGGWWKIAAIAGVGALAGGIYAGTRNGGTEAAAPVKTVSISAGVITVGGPR